MDVLYPEYTFTNGSAMNGTQLQTAALKKWTSLSLFKKRMKERKKTVKIHIN